jgi:hypothetical protein
MSRTRCRSMNSLSSALEHSRRTHRLGVAQCRSRLPCIPRPSRTIRTTEDLNAISVTP